MFPDWATGLATPGDGAGVRLGLGVRVGVSVGVGDGVGDGVVGEGSVRTGRGESWSVMLAWVNTTPGLAGLLTKTCTHQPVGSGRGGMCAWV